MADFNKMTKKQLIDIIKTQNEELKQVRQSNINLKSKDKPYKAVGVIYEDGKNYAAVYNVCLEDSSEVIECEQGPHMADYRVKQKLEEILSLRNQQILKR